MDLVFFRGCLPDDFEGALVLGQGFVLALFALGGILNRHALLHFSAAQFDGGLVHLMEVFDHVPVAIALGLDGGGAGVGVVGAVDVIDLALLGRLRALWDGAGCEDRRGG